MYTVNARVFLTCSTGAQFLKRLTQNQPLGCVSLGFATCNVGRSKKNTTLFTPVNIQPSTDTENVGEELTRRIEQKDLLKVINAFSRSPEVKILAFENGLDEKLYLKGFLSFRKHCLESKTLRPDLHITVSDILSNAGNPVDIFPYFLRFVKEMYPHLECLDDLKKIGDIQKPADWYLETRLMKRKIYFHCGPTNSGKTYQAIMSFMSSQSGIYCAPLKLLAVEIHKKTNAKGTPCDLITGEEIIYVRPDGDNSSHLSCTIEMCPVDKTFDVAVIDEIQMLRDPQRGWAWTRALLGLKAKEIHLCGEEGAINLVDSILCTTNEELEIRKYERLTKLLLDKPLKTLKNVRPGDCIVCFNKADIFSVAQSLEALGHKVALVYGSLPPHTKLAQCEKFNDPNDPCDVLVATDAVGMGLNLNIRRIVFYTIWRSVTNDSGETEKAPLSVSQALQIAGRAGRYGTNYEEGYVTTFKESEYRTLKNLLSQKPEPISQAGLLPGIDQIELFSYYLPKATLSELLDILIRLCTLDNSLYFLCDLKEFKFLSQMIDHVPLPLKVKFTFCCAPVNRKLHFVCVMFIQFAKMCSLNQAVTVSWIRQKIGWPLSKPGTLRDLVQLETYHEVLELYLWFSNRFEEYFPDPDVIRKIQKHIDLLVQEGMTNLSKLEKGSGSDEGKEQEVVKEEVVNESECLTNVTNSLTSETGKTEERNVDIKY